MLPLEVNGFGEARESGRIDDDLLLSRIAKGRPGGIPAII